MIVLGVGGFFLTGGVSPTALIPVLFGVILMVAGVISLKKPDLLKHAMHGAAVVALLGIFGTARSLGKLGPVFDGTAERPAAVISQAVMAILCLVFLILCIKSFIDVRRARQAAQG